MHNDLDVGSWYTMNRLDKPVSVEKQRLSEYSAALIDGIV